MDFAERVAKEAGQEPVVEPRVAVLVHKEARLITTDPLAQQGVRRRGYPTSLRCRSQGKTRQERSEHQRCDDPVTAPEPADAVAHLSLLCGSVSILANSRC